ncbi:DUF4150 domain-containing protein [Trinickia soli]|uniref:Uncharacterized protein n=1 Tax=Trinickia soli TaxID=380675 RepID=A0A2N7W6F6_9BURK|nr:DUF4150 domain-containing protein [Trinickia soli]KAA0081474.1 DUF4150 domain-containing protein [Paraburkholderia sp. T12-10]PMS24979.1 hypothetical protein C0Z19_11720 [Trinickia soli]CAB3646680.1 hypothetical protein LMG24076_00698 [Trinickia soli]
MFATNSIAAMSMMTVPDVCKTPIVVPVPIPYPNITMSTAHIPSVFNVMFGTGLAENLMTEGTISMGDEPGVEGGVVSGIFMGPDTYVSGSFKVIVGTAFATRLTSLVGMNGMPFNTIGMSIVPAQFRVLLLS